MSLGRVSVICMTGTLLFLSAAPRTAARHPRPFHDCGSPPSGL